MKISFQVGSILIIASRPLSLTLIIIAEDGMVACPICNRRMKNEAVFAHLDRCTGDPGPASKPAPAKPTSFGYSGPVSPRFGDFKPNHAILDPYNLNYANPRYPLQKRLRDSLQ